MRKLALWLSVAGVLFFALPGLAQDDADAPDADPEAGAAAGTTAERVDPVVVKPLAPPDPVIVERLVPPDPDEEEEDDEEFAEYRATVGNRYLVGLNGMITFPADPVMSTVSPDEEWDDLPLGVATKYPVGFFQGSLLMLYRLTAGTFDVVMAPLTPMRMISPEPRYLLFSEAEHEEY